MSDIIEIFIARLKKEYPLSSWWEDIDERMKSYLWNDEDRVWWNEEFKTKEVSCDSLTDLLTIVTNVTGKELETTSGDELYAILFKEGKDAQKNILEKAMEWYDIRVNLKGQFLTFSELLLNWSHLERHLNG